MAATIAALVVVLAAAALTLVVFLALREQNGLMARHYANLALPCGLFPLVVSLALAGRWDALPPAVLILLFLVISGVGESHATGRLGVLRRRARGRNG